MQTNAAQASHYYSVYFMGVWLFYALFSSVYIFPKGLPQPADIILITAVVPSLLLFALNNKGNIDVLYIIGGVFALLTFAINWVNFAFNPDDRLIKSTMYYPYNFAVFCFVVYLLRMRPKPVCRLTYYCLAIAVFVQLAWVVFFPDPGVSRMTGGFKNPNQLAYWSLLTAGMIFFIKRNEKLNLFDIGLMCILTYIEFVTLSKAGIISFLVLFTYMLFTPQITRTARALIFCLLLVISSYSIINPALVINTVQKIKTIERVWQDIAAIGTEKKEDPEGRGYNRLWLFPHYNVIGAGEGAFWRFMTQHSSREIHSGLATMLFAYGILGFALFGFFLTLIFWPQPFYVWLLFGFILMFSVTHQAFRFTHFWVLLGFAHGTWHYCSARTKQKRFPRLTPLYTRIPE